jgi:hypothetical protein
VWFGIWGTSGGVSKRPISRSSFALSVVLQDFSHGVPLLARVLLG